MWQARARAISSRLVTRRSSSRVSQSGAIPTVWSGLSIFFTADTHFGHGGALGLFRRPFASVAEMNEAVIARWNEAIRAGDEVWHLGDFAVRRSAAEVAENLGRLNGKIHLIIGNNDSAAIVSRAEFQSAQHYPG